MLPFAFCFYDHFILFCVVDDVLSAGLLDLSICIDDIPIAAESWTGWWFDDVVEI